MSRDRNKPWGGRFREDTDPAVERFSASIDFDRALARYDLRLSAAHARDAARAGADLAADELRAASAVSPQIGEEIASGPFPFDPSLEDIHMNVESRLRDR